MTNVLKYPCTQSALYQIAANVEASLRHYLTDFQAFKPKYTNAYLTILKNQIHTAETYPDFQARSAQAEVNYINQCQYLNTCCTQFQTLKRYITSTFENNQHKPRTEEAGSKYYRQATNKNWTAAQALFNSATLFITNHTSILLASNNMPSSFPLAFQNNINLFNQTLIAFQQAQEKIRIDTTNKIKANNSLYNTIIEICLDGQIIYKTNQAIKHQFTFTAIHQIVSGTTSPQQQITNNHSTI